MNSLRKGTIALASRQAIGMLVSLLFLLFVTKSIGVERYGVYISLVVIQGYIISMASLGLNIFIIRKTTDPEVSEYNTAFTIAFLLAVFLCMISLFVLLGTNFLPAVRDNLMAVIVIHFGVIFQVINLIGAAVLERKLLFAKVASSDLFGQIIGVGLSLVLVIYEKSVLSPVLGYVVGQLAGCLFTLFLSGYKPKIGIKRDAWREMVSYGISYSASMWIWQARGLINPLIVGAILGPSAVGLIAITQRILDMFSFFKIAIYRLSIAVLGKVKDDAKEMQNLLMIASNFQLIIVSFAILIYLSVGSEITVRFFGEEWGKITDIFPFIAFSSIMNSSFSLYSSVLYAIKENFQVAIFHGINIVILGIAAMIMVPRIGIIGFGIAEVVSAMSYIFLYRAVCLKIGFLKDVRFFALLASSLFGLLYYEIGYVSLLPFFSLFIFKKYRNIFVEGLNLRSGDKSEKS